MISQDKFIDKLFFSSLVAIGFIWIAFSFQFIENGIFWDHEIYTKAIAVFNNGGNPYFPDQFDGYLSFVYHPLVLHVMALFGSWLSPLLIVFYFATIIYFLCAILCQEKSQKYINSGIFKILPLLLQRIPAQVVLLLCTRYQVSTVQCTCTVTKQYTVHIVPVRCIGIFHSKFTFKQP